MTQPNTTVPSGEGKIGFTTPPPFTSGVKAPLTTAQRAAIWAWFGSFAPGSIASQWLDGVPSDHTKISDGDLLTVYNNIITDLWHNPNNNAGIGGIPVVGGPASSTIDAAESIPDFLAKLANPNLWIRVGEFAAGFLLLGIGTYVILKGSGNTPKLPTPGRVVSDGLKSKRTSAARRQSFQYQETGRDAQFRRTETSRDLAEMRRQNRPAAPKR